MRVFFENKYSKNKYGIKLKNKRTKCSEYIFLFFISNVFRRRSIKTYLRTQKEYIYKRPKLRSLILYTLHYIVHRKNYVNNRPNVYFTWMAHTVLKKWILTNVGRHWRQRVREQLSYVCCSAVDFGKLFSNI